MSISYSGDKGFMPKTLFVIGPNGNFIKTLSVTSTRGDFVGAGGVSTDNLEPFKSLELFTDYTESETFSSTNLSKFSALFSEKATKSSFSISTSITGDSKSVAPINDPRATHRVRLSNTNNNFASSLYTSISHMDEVVFSNSNNGETVQAFFMGFDRGVTLGSSRDILIGYVGTTGSGGATGFRDLGAIQGASFAINNAKAGTTSSVEEIRTIIKSQDFRDKVFADITSVTSGYKGNTFAVVFGDSPQRTAICRQDPFMPNSAVGYINQLLRLKQVLDLNHTCFTQDASFTKQFFVRNIDDNANDVSILGITLDGVSGGTNGTSEIDHLIASLDVKLREFQDEANRGLSVLSGVNTIRELCNVNF